MVCAGFVAGLFGDGLDSKISPSIVGIAYGIFSSFATALRAIYIKTSMEVVKGNTIELVWYNNVLSAVFMVPVVLAAGETNQAIELFTGDDASEEGRVSTFMLGLLVTGLFGFLINLAGFLQIKVTSPVSHMISGAFRGVLQTLLAVWAFGDILTVPCFSMESHSLMLLDRTCSRYPADLVRKHLVHVGEDERDKR